MIETEICACPCGELEGAPSLRIKASGVVAVLDLKHVVEANERPGVSVVWIDAAPWGSPDWDMAIRSVAESESMSHMVIVAKQPLAATRWSGFPKIQWAVDLTALLREPLTEAAVVEHLEQIAYVPTVREVVAFRPAPFNLQPAILDPLYQYLNPEAGGYVYVAADQAQRAMHALSRCTNPWSQRYWRPEHG